jgi:uncharacterized protein (TIGR00290 family)
LSWSSGKDSAWALHVLRQGGEYDVCGLLTTVTEPFDRVAMHGVRRDVLEAQAAAVGLPLHIVEIPSPCPNEEYEVRMAKALQVALDTGVTRIAFGDLFLADVRAYRERMLEGSGLEPVFPLWGSNTAALAREMIAAGLRATLTCVDPRQVEASLCGRPFDTKLLADLPPGADPCAEKGEFHTLAWDGPMFDAPLRLVTGPTVEREGFVFTDLSLR